MNTEDHGPVQAPLPAPASGTGLIGLEPAALVEFAALAQHMERANGPVIRAMNRFGGAVEARLRQLPAGAGLLMERAVAEALERIYRLSGIVAGATALPTVGPAGFRLAAATSGALGGAGGLATGIVELPATVALYFAAMQKIAAGHGHAPGSDETRARCIEIFGAGGPGSDDDGVDTSFIGARIALSGPALQALIRRVAPGLAAALARKLASQAVPVLGAASGAAINLAYLDYYRHMAHVRFGLAALAERHGAERAEAAFREAVERQRRSKRA